MAGHRPGNLLVLFSAAALVALAGCGGSPGVAVAPEATATAKPSPAATKAPPPSIAIAPNDSTTAVRPDDQVMVTVAHGELAAVTVRRQGSEGKSGEPLQGTFSPDRTNWVSDPGLRPGATYEVSATARGISGAEVTETATFATRESRDAFKAEIRPSDGSVVGIAMPVVLTFNEAVPRAYRANVERALSVETSVPMAGAWGWVSGREIHWRPKGYWPVNTRVTLHADLMGVAVDDGVWGDRDSTVSFQVRDRAVRSEVNLASHRLHLYVDDNLVKTIPITGGKSGFTTRSGIKVIIAKREHMRMRSESIGIADRSNPEYYDLSDVRYAMRVTWTGEFLHAAPWSVGSQGKANVSHGCTGMSTANAQWLFGVSKIGDPVKFVGSQRGLERGNGFTDWNVDWEQWQQRSALNAVDS